MTRGGPADACLVVALLLVLLTAAAAPGTGSHAGPATVPAVGQIEPDTVLLEVALQEDGSAAWEIRYRVRLDDDNATAAFDSLERDIEENRSAFTSRFEERMGGTVAAAENATGREMAVRNMSVRTTRQEIPQRYGVLIYGFEWTNFAVAEGETIEAGDAIGGLFLDESTSLTVQWPGGYGVDSTDPSPDETGDRSATWRGPQDFTTDQPRLVLSQAASGGSGGDGGDGGAGGGPPTTLLTLVAVAALAVVAGAGFWWYNREPDGPAPAAGEPVGTEPPEELLSNEERVVRLLEQHGGRMKQQQVVEELDWTDAKTSQVVGDLRESGEIEAFRLGRENVLNLPSEEDEEFTE